MRNRDYCRFHLQQIGRRMKAARSRARHQPPALKLPLLEDLYSVQVGLMQLADAIAFREIDPQYARLLTTVLRLAMQNLKGRQAWERSTRFQLASNTEEAVGEWNSFEREHDLPPDLDLSLDPEMAFPPQPENSAGAPHIPGVRLCGNDAVPLNPPPETCGPSVAQILRDSATPVPGSPVHVTADDVELMDVYEREGEQAMLKRVAEQQRNRNRRESRARHVYYDEVARNRNIQLAAEKLIADQQRDAKAAAAKAQPAPEDSAEATAHNEAEINRKPPQSEAATRGRKDPVTRRKSLGLK
jgi:hypothetical protein